MSQLETKRIEETTIVQDPQDFQYWCDELKAQFESETKYPETITISVEWED